MIPVIVESIAGRAESLSRPFDCFPECSRLSLQTRHADLIEQRRSDHERSESDRERDEPAL